jgi:ADP-ribose diphosphatase
MIEKWKFLDRTELLKHPRMTIVEDDVELPSGVKTKYIRHAPGASQTVCILAFNDKNEVLISREYSYPPDEVLYQLPGGMIEKGEDVLTAANRELNEEAGFAARDYQVIGSFFRDNRRSEAKQFVVLAKELYAAAAEADPEEFIENKWVSLDDLDALIAEGEIQISYMLAALTLYRVWSRKNS